MTTNNREIILQSVTGYTKNNKGVALEFGRHGNMKLSKIVRSKPDEPLGITKRIKITITYEA